MNDADINKKAEQIAVDSKQEIDDIIQPMNYIAMEESEIIDEINDIDIMAITPMQALQILFDLQKKIREI